MCIWFYTIWLLFRNIKWQLAKADKSSQLIPNKHRCFNSHEMPFFIQYSSLVRLPQLPPGPGHSKLKTETWQLLWFSVTPPLNWMACKSSFLVQINCSVQCRVPNPDYQVRIRSGQFFLMEGKTTWIHSSTLKQFSCFPTIYSSEVHIMFISAVYISQVEIH